MVSERMGLREMLLGRFDDDGAATLTTEGINGGIGVDEGVGASAPRASDGIPPFLPEEFGALACVDCCCCFDDDGGRRGVDLELESGWRIGLLGCRWDEEGTLTTDLGVGRRCGLSEGVDASGARE